MFLYSFTFHLIFLLSLSNIFQLLTNAFSAPWWLAAV